MRLADTGPVSAGFWRLSLAFPVIVALGFLTGDRMTQVPRRAVLLALLAGAFFGADIASWHIGIEWTRLGNATLFGNAGSIVLMIWSFVLLRRLPAGREWLAIIAALAGSAILLGRSAEISAPTLIGDLFCLLAGLFYAVYLLPMQKARGFAGMWSLLAWSGLAAIAVLFVIATARGEPFWPGDWRPVVALAFSSQIIGQGLLVYSLRHFPALIIGLALLTQPALASLVGWLTFGETLAWADVLGMILLAGALVIAKLVEARTVRLATAIELKGDGA